MGKKDKTVDHEKAFGLSSALFIFPFYTIRGN